MSINATNLSLSTPALSSTLATKKAGNAPALPMGGFSTNDSTVVSLSDAGKQASATDGGSLLNAMGDTGVYSAPKSRTNNIL
jgi:hypothetical protein